MERNTVRRIAGGVGGLGGTRAGGGAGGLGVAIHLTECPGARLAGNVVGPVEGGVGGSPSTVGDAVGVWVGSSAGVRSWNDLVYRVEGRAARGILWTAGSDGGRVENLTVFGVLGEEDATGVHVSLDCRLTLKNSIVAKSSHHGLWNDPANNALDLFVSYTDVWECGEECLAGVRAGPELLDADPQVINPHRDDYGLLPGSPCIDAGDRESPTDREPASADGARRIDLGHLGNTSDAQAL